MTTKEENISQNSEGIKHILLVEDDVELRETLSNYLVQCSYQVTQSPNDAEVLSLFDQHKIDLVISNLGSAHLGGVELAKFIKPKYRIPIIIMMNKKNPEGCNELLQIGVDELLQKPFKNKDLSDVIDILLSKRAGAESDPADDEFVRIPIDSFISKTVLDCDIYVSLGNTKKIKLGYAGSELSKHRVDIYKAKGVQHLYVKASESGKVIDFNKKLLQVVTSSPKLSSSQKNNFIKYTSDVILDKVRATKVFAEEDVAAANDAVEKTIHLLESNNKSLNLIENLNKSSNWALSHAYGVSVLSILMAQRLGYFGERDMKIFAMAGLLHDIGLFELDEAVISKPMAQMTTGDLEKFSRHAQMSRDYLTCAENIPTIVSEIIVNHHREKINDNNAKAESPEEKLIQKGIDILIAADFISYNCIKNPVYPQRSFQEALQLLKISRSQSLSSEIFNVVDKLKQRI